MDCKCGKECGGLPLTVESKLQLARAVAHQVKELVSAHFLGSIMAPLPPGSQMPSKEKLLEIELNLIKELQHAAETSKVLCDLVVRLIEEEKK